MAFPESVGDTFIWRQISDRLQRGLRQHFPHLEVDVSDGEPIRLATSEFPVKREPRTIMLDQRISVSGATEAEITGKILEQFAKQVGFMSGYRHLVLGPLDVRRSGRLHDFMCASLLWGYL